MIVNVGPVPTSVSVDPSSAALTDWLPFLADWEAALDVVENAEERRLARHVNEITDKTLFLVYALKILSRSTRIILLLFPWLT
jgi:hypothetical protein